MDHIRPLYLLPVVPRLDLHFAAASGNLGLVEYALSHGQPINSVLNGVLPLHAACAGGSEVVVKYLIDEGADVNAPRYVPEDAPHFSIINFKLARPDLQLNTLLTSGLFYSTGFRANIRMIGTSPPAWL